MQDRNGRYSPAGSCRCADPGGNGGGEARNCAGHLLAWRIGVSGGSRATPLQALVTATSASATAFRLSDRGRIAPGLRADLVLVKGNPTEDIRATRDIERIWKAGILFCRQQWLNRSQQNGATASEILQHRGTRKAASRSVLPRSC